MTGPDAAAAAAAAGADAVGLIFHEPSHRHLTLEQAAAIREALPPMVDSVAVMVNPDADYVRAILDRVGPSMLQFHGEEPDEYCAGFGVPYLKTIRVSGQTDPASLERDYPRCHGILLDTFTPDKYGGSGLRFDWGRAAYGGTKPVFLAGGLDVDNVREALDTARPYGVDVSTSLETGGVKDPDKVLAFCRRVQDLDNA